MLSQVMLLLVEETVELAVKPVALEALTVSVCEPGGVLLTTALNVSADALRVSTPVLVVDDPET
jgi:hypothetical protein